MEPQQAVSAASEPRPIVSVVIPTMNEVSFVGTALDSLRAQTYPVDRLEILAVDGGSTDGTVEFLDQRARADPRIRVLGGPGVNCPAALNIGITEARGSIVWYLGGHGQADPRYLDIAVGRLIADSTLGCVGGLIVPTGEGHTARSNMIARFSVFGVGRGVLTTDASVHELDTVQWGAYRKDALKRAGLFDADLQFGEDEELNFRVRRAGFRILYDPALRITYFARPTFKGLFRQYRNYGRARVRVVRKHPSFFRPKHALPAALMIALILAAILPLIFVAAWPLSLLIACSYGAFIVGGSLFLAYRERFPYPHFLVVSLMCLHLGYGLGTILGVGDLARKH
jgi:succinoglycan biosynthesis protein ExoA